MTKMDGPIEVRCARHVFGIERILANYSEMYEEPIIVTGMPSYDELVKMEWVPTSMSLPRDQGRIDRNEKRNKVVDSRQYSFCAWE